MISAEEIKRYQDEIVETERKKEEEYKKRYLERIQKEADQLIEKACLEIKEKVKRDHRVKSHEILAELGSSGFEDNLVNILTNKLTSAGYTVAKKTDTRSGGGTRGKGGSWSYTYTSGIILTWK